MKSDGQQLVERGEHRRHVLLGDRGDELGLERLAGDGAPPRARSGRRRRSRRPPRGWPRAQRAEPPRASSATVPCRGPQPAHGPTGRAARCRTGCRRSRGRASRGWCRRCPPRSAARLPPPSAAHGSSRLPRPARAAPSSAVSSRDGRLAVGDRHQQRARGTAAADASSISTDAASAQWTSSSASTNGWRRVSRSSTLLTA